MHPRVARRREDKQKRKRAELSVNELYRLPVCRLNKFICELATTTTENKTRRATCGVSVLNQKCTHVVGTVEAAAMRGISIGVKHGLICLTWPTKVLRLFYKGARAVGGSIQSRQRPSKICDNGYLPSTNKKQRVQQKGRPASITLLASPHPWPQKDFCKIGTQTPEI